MLVNVFASRKASDRPRDCQLGWTGVSAVGQPFGVHCCREHVVYPILKCRQRILDEVNGRSSRTEWNASARSCVKFGVNRSLFELFKSDKPNDRAVSLSILTYLRRCKISIPYSFVLRERLAKTRGRESTNIQVGREPDWIGPEGAGSELMDRHSPSG
jgi:hypothetical protein